MDPVGQLQHIRFVIGGSINLQTTLDQFHLVSTVNDLAAIVVGPIRDDLAPGFVRLLFAGKGVEIGDAEVARILRLVGPPIPYFVQIMVDKISEEHLYYHKPLTLDLYRSRVQGLSPGECGQDRLSALPFEAQRVLPGRRGCGEGTTKSFGASGLDVAGAALRPVRKDRRPLYGKRRILSPTGHSGE